MDFSLLLKNIIVIVKNNLDNIYSDKNTKTTLNINNISKENIKDFLDIYLDFVIQENKFYYLYNLDNSLLSDNIEELKQLGVNLNKLKKILIEKYNKINEQIIEEKLNILEDIFEKNNIDQNSLREKNKEMYNSVQIKDIKEMMFFLLYNLKDNFLFNKEVRKNINNLLGYDYLNESINILTFNNLINVCLHEMIFGVDEYNVDVRSYEEKYKILLKKIDIVSKLNSDDSNNMMLINDINKNLIKIYNNNRKFSVNNEFSFVKNFNSKEIDLFELLFKYDNLAKNNIISKKNTIEDKTLKEIFNYTKNKLTNYEIAYLLYDFYVVFNNKEILLNNNQDFVFKDLTELIDMIVRRKKDGANYELLIDNIASGKIKINLPDKKIDGKNVKKL